VRVVQRRGGARFALEPLESETVTGEPLQQKLERDAPAEARVLPVVDLAHAPGPKRADDAIATDGRARGEAHQDLREEPTIARLSACGGL
jgi:hypothetical protein